MKDKFPKFFPLLLCSMILCASCGAPPSPEEISGYQEIKEAAEKAQSDAEKAVAEIEKSLGEIPQTNYEGSIEREQPSPAEQAETKIDEDPESAALRLFLTAGSFLCVDVQGGAKEMIGTRFTFSNGVILVQNQSIQKEVPFDIDFAMQDFKGSKFVGVLLVNDGQKESVQVIDDNAMILSWNGESVKLGLERE